MTREEHERELGILYRAAQNREKTELALDILGQLKHYGYNLPPVPPLMVPEHLEERVKTKP